MVYKSDKLHIRVLNRIAQKGIELQRRVLIFKKGTKIQRGILNSTGWCQVAQMDTESYEGNCEEGPQIV